MKKQIILAALVVFTIYSQTNAQNRSCDAAYRFDASYTRDFDKLENVNISLQSPKPVKNPADRQGKSESGQSYYVAPGATSTKQFVSADANIGFKMCYVLHPNLELYKADVRSGMRTFTIPTGTGGNLAVNIPIQILTPPGTTTPSNGVAWGKGAFKVKFINGYLQSGEYILIDKNTISSDGSQITGYAFTIK